MIKNKDRAKEQFDNPSGYRKSKARSAKEQQIQRYNSFSEPKSNDEFSRMEIGCELMLDEQFMLMYK